MKIVKNRLKVLFHGLTAIEYLYQKEGVFDQFTYLELIDYQAYPLRSYRMILSDLNDMNKGLSKTYKSEMKELFTRLNLMDKKEFSPIEFVKQKANILNLVPEGENISKVIENFQKGIYLKPDIDFVIHNLFSFPKLDAIAVDFVERIKPSIKQ
jgi:hypothetical protein